LYQIIYLTATHAHTCLQQLQSTCMQWLVQLGTGCVQHEHVVSMGTGSFNYTHVHRVYIMCSKHTHPRLNVHTVVSLMFTGSSIKWITIFVFLILLSYHNRIKVLLVFN